MNTGIKHLCAALKMLPSPRKRDFLATKKWAGIMNSLGQMVEHEELVQFRRVNYRHGGGSFLYPCPDYTRLRQYGLSGDQIRAACWFATRNLSQERLEDLLEWLQANSRRPLSRTSILHELACTGVPEGYPRWSHATWQKVGHKGADGEIYYAEGTAL
jgi:hypothetical protein